MLITHEAFTEFGYGFGNMETLTGMYYNWLTVPVMSAVGACSIFCSFSVTYNGNSCFCRTGLLCVSNLRIIKVTSRPYIHHLCLLLALTFCDSLTHLFTGVLEQLCGSYSHRCLLLPSRRCH